MVDEAYKNHLKVIGHTAFNLSLQEVVGLGQDGIEHAQFLIAAKRDEFEPYGREYVARKGTPWAMRPPEVYSRWLYMEDPKEEERVYRTMAAKQVWVTPTRPF